MAAPARLQPGRLVGVARPEAVEWLLAAPRPAGVPALQPRVTIYGLPDDPPRPRSVSMHHTPEPIEAPVSDRFRDVDNPCERAGRRLDSRPRTWSFPMIWYCCWMIALWNSEQG